MPTLINPRTTGVLTCLLVWLWCCSHAVLAQAPVEPILTPEATVGGEEAATTDTTDADEPAPYQSRNHRDQQLLAKAVPEEVRWLDTTGDEQVLALFRPVESRVTQGVVLILHAAETPPGWPPALENARRALPRHGWITLAVALPPPIAPALPERDPPQPIAENTDEANPATEDSEPEAPSEAAITAEPTEPVMTRAEVIAQRVTAALAWLAQENYAPVVLLVDNSSVVDSLASFNAGATPLSALVLINLQAQEQLATAELEAIFSENSPPVLDVFFAPRQSLMTPARKHHRAVALRNNVPVYQQLHLPPPLPASLEDDRSFWVERLRGFMQKQQKRKK